MASLAVPSPRRVLTTLVLAVAALSLAALMPRDAHAAQPATVRLMGTDPIYRGTTMTTTTGQRVAVTPGWFRLRVTPAGGAPVERRGFCVDAYHPIGTGVDYSVSLRTAADEPALAGARSGEVAWLLQNASSLIGAAPSGARGLEAGALQVAVWQLTGQAREVSPTDDAGLNARAAALRALAAGRAAGGPVTLTAAMARGCAGRGSVALTLTGTPGATATLSVAGAGTVAPAEVRFGADGTARASLSSSAPGVVTVTARSEGGTLTRIARATAGQTTPQETMVLVPATYQATATVTFEDCPLVPLSEPQTPDPSSGDSPVGPFGGASPETKTPSETSPPPSAEPRHPTQASPTLAISKTGPARAQAGATAVYRIRARNRGTRPASGVTVTDALPDGMSLTSRPAGSRLRAGRLVWSLGSLQPGAVRSLTVRVRIDADASGRRCNRATVEATGAPARTATACTTVVASRRRILPPVTA
jgi:uncharacterized repeat protein (TIGR01451 family)